MKNKAKSVRDPLCDTVSKSQGFPKGCFAREISVIGVVHAPVAIVKFAFFCVGSTACILGAL